LDNKLYVVYRLSNAIHVYSADLSDDIQVIAVDGMKYPIDIVACPHDGQLYVADSRNCPAEVVIWRVSAAVRPSQYVNLLTAESSSVQSLSVRSTTLLMTSSEALHQYSTTDGHLLGDVKLPEYIEYLYHGVETERGTYVVSHRGTELSELHVAVSKLINILDSMLTPVDPVHLRCS